MRKIIFSLLLTAFIPLLSMAQEPTKELGMRFGGTTGFDVKFNSGDEWAFETILGFRGRGIQVYGLMENIKPIMLERLDNLFLYYGGGGHLGFVRWSDPSHWYDDPYYDHRYDFHTGFAMGVDGIVGVEYKFHSVPLSMGVDFKPFFEIYGPFFFRVNAWDFGFNVRYVF
jgi:hypothetical protein